MKNLRIGVFLTSALEIDPAYREQTKSLARLLATRGHEVVFGGTDYGLMKVLADEYKDGAGRKLTGVFAADLIAVTKNYQKSPRLDQEFTEKTMQARKQRMMDLSDGFVVFPGGYGTFEELAAIVAGKANKLYDKPIAVFSVKGFYDGLMSQLTYAHAERFSKIDPNDILKCTDDIEALVSYLEDYSPKELADKFVK